VGNWGRYGHLPALKLLPEYEVVAVSSRRMDSAIEIAGQFGAPHAFDDPTHLVGHPDVEMVNARSPGIIPTPGFRNVGLTNEDRVPHRGWCPVETAW
jgi:hypothetical protein